MQLIYRGQAFDFQPSSNRPSKTAGALSRTLFYRGNTYVSQVSLPKTRLPKAVNWRYSLPCETPKGLVTPAH